MLPLLMGNSCETSTNYAEPNFYLPDQPQSCTNAGNYVSMPKQNIDTKGTKQLLTALAKSDRRNAYAVNSCKRYHQKLQALYNKN